MIDTELDDTMADLLLEAASRPDGTLAGADVHPVGAVGDPVNVWRGPAMTRLCAGGLFEVHELPTARFVLTDFGWLAAAAVA